MSSQTAFLAARGADDRVVLEGLHPLKHALRFGAQVLACVVEEGCDLTAAAAALAPDLLDHLPVAPEAVPADVFAQLCRHRPPVPVVAIARRPAPTPSDVLARPGRAVLLEDPVHLGNIGAVVRVAAAADAAGVVTTGGADPWHPAALRGAAGLHFALPVARGDERTLDVVAASGRRLVAFDPDGDRLGDEPLDPRAVLAFGTERAGLSAPLLARADRVVAIAMRDGVSSLNLATSVAVALYATH